MKAAAYLRVSTEEQRERQTIETQRGVVRRYCESHGVEVVEEYADDGVSGAVPLGKRPDGARLLRDAERGRFEAVVFRDLTRLGRETIETLSALRDLRERGIQAVSATEDLTDLFLTEIRTAVASDERRRIVERSREGTRRKAKAGGWLGGPVPYAYRVEGERGDATLRPSEKEIDGTEYSEADLVHLMFEMAAQGRSCREIADHLNALAISPGDRADDGSTRGIRTKRIASRWRAGRVNRILKQTIYKGTHRFKISRRKGQAPEIIEREFPALVSPEMWDATQAALKANIKSGAQRAKRTYLLSGKIRCSKCGLALVGSGFRDNRGKARAYYTKQRTGRFWSDRGEEPCPGRVIPARELEGRIWKEVVAMCYSPGEVLEELREGVEIGRSERDRIGKEIEQLRSLREAKEGERQEILRLRRRGTITDEDVDRQFAEIADEEQALAARIEERTARLEAAQDAENRFLQVDQVLRDLRGRLRDPDALSPERKREIIDALLEEIVVTTVADENDNKTNELEIVYRFDPSLIGAAPPNGTRSWRP